ncbi:threonine dehydratase [Rhizobium sp. BK650]|uniref:threonine/serine dehydratase n=1 Tax=Rhizobium sp. BK650 TaxID=2586990 RepID=UPI0016127162|nr:threonine/serine dehydratase [Rhizobium sp. BK650]MBB3660049.1 threonine dehydratase [Rhizobium sp. BK650]
MSLTEDVRSAERRIRQYVNSTPLEAAPYLLPQSADIYVKLENLQHTGSFKLRGALNKVLTNRDAALNAPFVAASSGNHGAALAYALKQVGGQGIVYVPEGASVAKVKAIRSLGAEVRVHGKDTSETEAQARLFAQGEGLVYVSPYNDEAVIAGQGTLGIEILEQLPDVSNLFVAVGGGGLIAGIASYVKDIAPHVKIFGCSPERSRAMAASVRAGRIVEVPLLETLSDGTAGGLEPGAITFDLCRRLVDQWVDVTEQEISTALRDFIRGSGTIAEGAAGVALAASVKVEQDLRPGRSVVVVCGGNISSTTMASILS